MEILKCDTLGKPLLAGNPPCESFELGNGIYHGGCVNRGKISSELLIFVHFKGLTFPVVDRLVARIICLGGASGMSWLWRKNYATTSGSQGLSVNFSILTPFSVMVQSVPINVRHFNRFRLAQ